MDSVSTWVCTMCTQDNARSAICCQLCGDGRPEMPGQSPSMILSLMTSLRVAATKEQLISTICGMIHLIDQQPDACRGVLTKQAVLSVMCPRFQDLHKSNHWDVEVADVFRGLLERTDVPQEPVATTGSANTSMTNTDPGAPSAAVAAAADEASSAASGSSAPTSASNGAGVANDNDNMVIESVSCMPQSSLNENSGLATVQPRSIDVVHPRSPSEELDPVLESIAEQQQQQQQYQQQQPDVAVLAESTTVAPLESSNHDSTQRNSATVVPCG